MYGLLFINMSQPIDVQLIHKDSRVTLALQAYEDGYFTCARGAADMYNPLDRFYGHMSADAPRDTIYSL